MRLISALVFPLSLLLSCLTIISLLVTGLDVALAGMPEKIHSAYRGVVDRTFYWIVEWWLPFKVPVEVKDGITFWIFCSGVLYKYYDLIGALKGYGRMYMLGPLIFLMSIYLLTSDQRKYIEYKLFWVMHLVMLVFYLVVAALFLWWNHSSIESLASIPK